MKKKDHSPKRMPSFIWISLVVVASIATHLLLQQGTPTATGAPRPTAPGDATPAAPAFTLTDINGKSVSLSDFKGKVVILDFWATWCPPCKREIPDFIKLQKEFGSRGLQVVGIALDEPGKVQAYASQNGINYPVLLGSDDIAWKYGGIQGIPTTFIIDKTGKIVSKFEGYRPREVFESEIKKKL